MKEFTIPLRYMPQFTNYDDEVPEAEWRRVERRAVFTTSLCAFVIVDAWDTHFMMGARTDAIIRKRIEPVVNVCRALGMPVIHAPSPPVAEKYPDHRFRPTPDGENRGIHPIATEIYDSFSGSADGWPTRDMFLRTGEFAEYSLRTDPEAPFLPTETLYARYHIHPDLGPEKGDWVVADNIELDALLREKRKYHLFYAGFVSNGCIQERDYGVKFMQYLGYNPILLRDCTTALEMAHTITAMEQSKASIDNVEFWVPTSTSESLIAGLNG